MSSDMLGQRKKRRVRDIHNNLVNREDTVVDFNGNYIHKDLAVELPGGNYVARSEPLLFIEAVTDAPTVLKNLVIATYFEKNKIKNYSGNFLTEEDISKGIRGGILANNYDGQSIFLDKNDRISIISWETIRTYNSSSLVNDYIVQVIDSKSEPIKYTYKSLIPFLGAIECYDRGVFIINPSTSGKYSAIQVKTLEYSKFNNIYQNNVRNSKLFKIKFGEASPTYLITEGLRHTFGVELETCSGRLQPYDYKSLNIKCVRDGSLRNDDGVELGGEYVTGVLTGDAGFNQINNLCSVLSTKCLIDKKCGVHVHIGVTPTPLFIASLYYLLKFLEKEVFLMMPKSRRGGPHSKPLPNIEAFNIPIIDGDVLKTEAGREFLIDKIYKEIYSLMLYTGRERRETRGINFGSKFQQHPLGDKCQYDKSSPRYCWVNFVPALFLRQDRSRQIENPENNEVPTFQNEGLRIGGINITAAPILERSEDAAGSRQRTDERKLNKSFTIEFRVHSASLNFAKIKNWIKICVGIINYAENIPLYRMLELRDSLNLNTVLTYSYPKTGQKLLEYIQSRKEKFKLIEEDETVETDNFIETGSTLKPKLINQ